MPQIKKDERPSRNAWSPGDYECRCINCDEAFIGDKRALWCADCVYGDDPNSRHIDMLHAKLTAERAKAAALRSALENHAVERDIECVEPYECALCLGTGATREAVKHADYCTLAATSGAALAAAIEAVLAGWNDIPREFDTATAPHYLNEIKLAFARGFAAGLSRAVQALDEPDGTAPKP